MTLAAHFVTDRRRFHLTPAGLVERTTRAARGGAAIIQVRERDLADADLARLVADVLRGAAGTAAKVLVNDRLDVALACGAHGVHLRADSFAASRVRAAAPDGFIIGRSVHTMEEIDAACDDGGSDYLLFGTVFRSSGKPAGHPAAGLAGLRAACLRSRIPVIAIGGVDETRLAAIADAGAAGFAGVAMFM